MVSIWVVFIFFCVLFVCSRFPTMNISYNYNTRESKHYYLKKMMRGCTFFFFFFSETKKQLPRTMNFLFHPSRCPDLSLAWVRLCWPPACPRPASQMGSHGRESAQPLPGCPSCSSRWRFLRCLFPPVAYRVKRGLFLFRLLSAARVI